MTTAPMCRSVSSFAAAARLAVGSIVTTSPCLAAKMFLTIIAASLVPAAEGLARDFEYGQRSAPRLVPSRDRQCSAKQQELLRMFTAGVERRSAGAACVNMIDRKSL